MHPAPRVAATVTIDPLTPAVQAGGPLALTTAHGSSTTLHLCFSPRPSRPLRLAASRPPGHRWAIVLAGGDGKRLAGLTRAVHGEPRPKQYCSLAGNTSLLADALARASAVADRERVLTVVAREHEVFWQAELRHRDPRNVVVQPQNRGTAAGILLPLLAIAERDPGAVITLLPADHFVADEPRLAATLRLAQRAAARLPDRVLVVGIEPDAPEIGYGWILPDGRRRGPLRRVHRFVEKPALAEAEELLRAGAVWNSFVLAGRADAFLQLYRRRAPRLLEAFERERAHARAASAARLYATLPAHDFCGTLLAGSEPHLLLYRAPACGWTDLGTPARVAACASWLVRHRGIELRGGSLGAAVGSPARAGARAP